MLRGNVALPFILGSKRAVAACKRKGAREWACVCSGDVLAERGNILEWEVAAVVAAHIVLVGEIQGMRAGGAQTRVVSRSLRRVVMALRWGRESSRKRLSSAIAVVMLVAAMSGVAERFKLLSCLGHFWRLGSILSLGDTCLRGAWHHAVVCLHSRHLMLLLATNLRAMGDGVAVVTVLAMLTLLPTLIVVSMVSRVPMISRVTVISKISVVARIAARVLMITVITVIAGFMSRGRNHFLLDAPGRQGRHLVRAKQFLVHVKHVVRANIAQENADLVVLDDVPNRRRHRDEKHRGRAQEHGFEGNNVG